MAMMLLVLLFISCVSLLLPCVRLEENIRFENYNPLQLTENLPGYGITWMYFPSSNGTPMVVQLEPELILNTRFKSSAQDSVKFYLYTRSNQDSGHIIDPEDNSTLYNSNISYANPIKVMVHGWTSSHLSDTSQTIKNNFLEADDCNVILVDWKEIASNLVYPIPVMETKNVGDQIGKMVDFLVANGANLDDIHIIGHSLGAHVAGRAGHAVNSGRVKRITGLDPALPGFEFVAPNENKLDSSDAQFVDVIHTCGGILGYYSRLGHADFYPNGGVPAQPGCFGLPQIIEGCSHGRAWQYFAQSIKSKDNFLGIMCESWEKYKNGECAENDRAVMGAATPYSAQGVYYLRTGEEKSVFRAVGDAFRTGPTFFNEAITQAKNGLRKLLPRF